MKEQLDKDGYVILKDYIDKGDIINIKTAAKKIFQIQFDYFKYPHYVTTVEKINDELFRDNIIRLFNEHEDVFKNCGKLIQTGLIHLYSLLVNYKIYGKLIKLGIKHPCGCTRPVLFFNHPKLAKSKEYYMTPKHQDWPSMESSMNSLVVWVPLVDVNKENGSIILYPGSHKKGVLPFKSVGGFGTVEYEGESIQPEMEIGDIAIFSTLLVHESGPILNDTIRWSAHFRYNCFLQS